MKRLNDILAFCLGTIMLCSCAVTQAQNGNAIDRVIEKWKDQDGIKTTYVQKKVKDGQDVFIQITGSNQQFTREAQAAVNAEKDNSDRVTQNKRNNKSADGKASERELTVLEITTKTNPAQRITYVWKVEEGSSTLSSHIRPRISATRTIYADALYIDGALATSFSGLDKLKDIDWGNFEDLGSMRVFNQNDAKILSINDKDIRRYSNRLKTYQKKYQEYLRRYKELESNGKLDDNFIRQFRNYEQRFKHYQDAYLKRIKAYEKMLRQSKSQLGGLDQELERADKALEEADSAH